MTAQAGHLMRDQAYIDGQWVDAGKGRHFAVTNPATGAVLGRVPDMGAVQTREAIAAAQDALAGWKALTGKERYALLNGWFTKIMAQADALAALLSAEQGKPLAEAKGEVVSGAHAVQWAAEEAKRLYGDFLPAHKSDARIVVSREAIGVVGAITPWNFPSAMITRKVAPAMAAGCTVVLKPAAQTPLSALALAVLAEEAGFPSGIFNVVTGTDAAAIGEVLTGDERVRKISFTGSTEVGRVLMAQAAPTIKKIALELGGNAPFIVFESADIGRAVEGAMASKFRNAGQTCISANRIYVHGAVYEEFTSALIDKTQKMKIGAGDEKDVEIGPLIDSAAVEKVESLVKDALNMGAKVETGGGRHERGELFFQPTVLSGMRDGMKMTCAEIFGPVAPLYRFETDEEVIARANETQYGLASYIYSNDHRQIWRVCDALEYGMVGVNEPLLATELAPFGGVKQSGIGREGARQGVEEYTEVKYRLFGGL